MAATIVAVFFWPLTTRDAAHKRGTCIKFSTAQGPGPLCLRYSGSYIPQSSAAAVCAPERASHSRCVGFFVQS